LPAHVRLWWHKTGEFFLEPVASQTKPKPAMKCPDKTFWTKTSMSTQQETMGKRLHHGRDRRNWQSSFHLPAKKKQKTKKTELDKKRGFAKK
jgi:hypothetical protein